MVNDAVSCLEIMRYGFIRYWPGNIDTDTHVSWEVSFRLQDILKYILPEKYEVYMDTTMGLIINNNFFTEKERIQRQKNLSEMHKLLALADPVIHASYDMYAKTSHLSEAPKSVPLTLTLHDYYGGYRDHMVPALAWLEKYLHEGGVGTMRFKEAGNSTDAEQAEMRSLLARLTQRYS